MTLIGSHFRQHGMTRSTFRGAGLFVETAEVWCQTQGREKNRLIGEGATDRKAAVPNGYVAPYAWLLAIKSGGLSASSNGGSGALSAAGAMGVNAAATMAGVGDVTGVGQLVVSAVATLTGSGAISSAAAVAYLNAAATLAGSGDLAGTADAIGHAVAALAGTGSVSDTLTATGELVASITPFTDLSPQSLASAVWSSPEGAFLYAVAHHRVTTDPAAGTYTVYDTDDVTPLYVAALWENAAGTTAYQGSGAERRDRFA